MAKLENSKRRMPQAVYAKIDLKQNHPDFSPKRPWMKWALIAAGKPSRDEIAQVKAGLERDRSRLDHVDSHALDAELRALEAIEPLLFLPGGADPARFAPVMSQIESAALVALADRLIEVRTDRVNRATEIVTRLTSAFHSSSGGAIVRPPEEQPPAGFHEVEEDFPHLPGVKVYRAESETRGPAPKSGEAVGPALHSRTHTIMVPAPAAHANGRAEHDSLTLQDLADWAISAEVDVADAKWAIDAARGFGYDPQTLRMADYPAALEQVINHSVNVVTAFKKQIDLEPVGFLHLERLTFAPDGIERGELVYSVPLAPAEEVNIAHKEWANTSQEFEKIVTDSLEEYSEQGVTEKSELSQSTSSQQQHSSGINTAVTASGGYGPVSMTSSVSANFSDSHSETSKFSRDQSISVTRKASSRSKTEHKMSFKVASASGTEDQAVRRFKNPFPDKAIRVDYYQLIRKWEVSVYRYGIRLTYDITVPEPGSDVLSKITEINNLTEALAEGFGDSNVPWARFVLKPNEITRQNYMSFAAKYNATVPNPPAEHKWYDTHAEHKWGDDEAGRNQYFALEVTVDDDYEVDAVDVDTNHTEYQGESAAFHRQSTDDFLGTSGPQALIYSAVWLGSLYVELRVRAKLREEAFQDWQLKAWGAMRDAAQSRYYEQRSLLQDQLSRLQEALGAEDALSLRKFEREEIMKGVLRWLFGPDFEFVPSGLPEDLYGKNESIASDKHWKEMRRHGEMIQFLHHAIEWENVLYFLYPYFWSHLKRWELKKYLDHPDPMHRTFLKAGSARVVLTIRPGFERHFMSLLETGSFDGLGADDPYMTIIDEMEKFAETNYPSIPPANPEEATKIEEGQLIGSWYEYTPTSALDIAFAETLPDA